MERKNVNKILATTIAGVIVISSFVAFASPVMNNIGGRQFKQQGQTGMQMRPNQLSQDEMLQKLQAIVDLGKITADQKASIVTALNDEQTARKAEMDKVKEMTEEQRTAYFKDNVFVSPIDILIEKGVITAQQAAYVKRAIGGERGNKFGMNEKGRQFEGKQGQRGQNRSTPSAIPSVIQ